MRLYLVDITKTLLCVVSLLLTGLFALSFADHPPSALGLLDWAHNNVAAILLIIVGIGIDLSKYLFWYYRPSKLRYTFMSLLLVLFSWAASVSYFMTQESESIETKRRETQAYQAFEATIASLQQEIAHKETLINTRLASQYHEQWDKGEQLLSAVRVLNAELQTLLAQSATVGVNEARTRSHTTAFFLQLSEVLQVSLATVTLVAYGVLALLIEFCALGTISLSQQRKQLLPYPSAQPKETSPQVSNVAVGGHPEANTTPLAQRPLTLSNKTTAAKKSRLANDKKQRLRNDIIQGRIRPVFADIKRARYGLSQAVIKSVLVALYQEGYLTRQNRRYQVIEEKR